MEIFNTHTSQGFSKGYSSAMKGGGNHLQSGFTLVEVAIVLVIIGLILGGVFKG